MRANSFPQHQPWPRRRRAPATPCSQGPRCTLHTCLPWGPGATPPSSIAPPSVTVTGQASVGMGTLRPWAPQA